jgi:hypothetical protein
MLYGYHVSNFVLTQTVYFYIICYYLRLKLRNINNEIVIKNRRNSILSEFQVFVKYVTRSLSSIYMEIKEYNDNYWSKFMFWFTFLLNTCVNALLYKSIYGISNAYLVLTIRYFAFLCTFVLLVLFFTASSVCIEVNRSYNLLNKLYVSNLFLRHENFVRFKVL